MTIDEAIKHCKEVAKNLYSEGDDVCTKWANEQEQLAEWLKELKAYQELFTSPEEAEKLLEQFMV